MRCLAWILLWTGAFGCFAAGDREVRADGRLLRGERWRPFVHDGNRADFYIAPNGNDRWSGTLPVPNEQRTDGPFATLERAQAAVRELKKAVYRPKQEPIEKRWIGSPHQFGEGRDIVVLLRGGVYHLDKPVVFAPPDGGERCETNLPSGAFEYHKLKDYFVTYAAYPGETPILCGGVTVGPWQAHGRLWAAPFDGEQVSALVVNGRLQTLARAPNTGSFTVAEIPRSVDAFRFRKDDLRTWPRMEENRIVMRLRWHTGINSIARIDTERRIAHLRKPQPGIRIVPPRYYVENVPALLDAPGEWYFDRRAHELRYLPYDRSLDLHVARTVVPRLAGLIALRGQSRRPVRNLRLYGLALEATTAGGHAVSLQYAHSCELVDGSIRAVGGTAVTVGKGCYATRILNNRIAQAVRGGIAVEGKPHPDDWFDIIRQTEISRNTLSECGGASIAARNCLATRIAHNEIMRNRGRTAIRVGGWRNLEEAIDGGYRVERNHVHHVQQYADDSGAITTAGLTHDSMVRANLIHDVFGGFFNDNVAIWFDNMSSGWRAEENIFYNLDQGEMKLCAANLVDNLYANNHLIEAPTALPEGIIEGEPALKVSGVRVLNGRGEPGDTWQTGQIVLVRGTVHNVGATGISEVPLFVDGRPHQRQSFPITYHGRRPIQFHVQWSQPGEHRVAIADAAYVTITVTGPPRSLLYRSLELADSILPEGGKLQVSARIDSVVGKPLKVDIPLLIDGTEVDRQTVRFAPRETRTVRFTYQPIVGSHRIQIGDAPPARVQIYSHRPVRFSTADIQQTCSPTATPCKMDIDVAANRYHIEVAGSDFYHGEDSYAAVFLPSVRGNFVATVKIARFGERTHEWFRAGLFVRNNMAHSFGVGDGSLGSVLAFATPGRTGIQWDQYGDGCMHKAVSRNRDCPGECPVWLRLVRQGDRFAAYTSDDGRQWIELGRTAGVPGLADAIDVGLAAGGPDQRVYQVDFEDFTLDVQRPRDGGVAAPRE